MGRGVGNREDSMEGDFRQSDQADMDEAGSMSPDMEKESGFARELLGYIKILVAAFVLCWILTRVVFVNAYIPSSSMENTIMTGSRVLGIRLAYRFSDPSRGDIVIFHYPVDEDTLYIKRVIGLPGETVTISDGLIYIDGIQLNEDYLPEEWYADNDGYTFTVPEGCYFMMGDNRNVSIDSRFWADEALAEGVASTPEEAESYTYVKKEKIVAKAFVVYWPVSEVSIIW